MDFIPKISIILPTFNGSKYIFDTIESVIQQTFHDWELLVVDDGSTDNLYNVVKNLQKKDSRIIYLKNENNLGIQKTLNRGVNQSRGKYIARIDDDDIWIDKEKLEKQFIFLEDNLDYGIVGTGVILIDENRVELSRYLLPETDKEIRQKMLSKNCFMHSAVLFRRDIIFKFDGYSETLETKHVEDYDLWLKIGTLSKFYNFPSYATLFMVRNESISSKNKLEQAKKNLFLSKKYKEKYPCYLKGLIVGYLRIMFFQFSGNKVFKLFYNKILKTYKEF